MGGWSIYYDDHVTEAIERVNMVIVSYILILLVCFGIPTVGFLVLRKKEPHMGKVFVAGCLTFFISQICIRLPILQIVLPQYAWFTVMGSIPLLAALFYGGTAGIAEEVGRWIAIKFFLKKERSLEYGLTFGLGHGGIEAVLIIGIPMAAQMVQVITSQVSPDVLSVPDLLLGALERVYAITFHVGASLLVMYGFRVRKSVIYLVLAIALHTLLDGLCVILPTYGAGNIAITISGILIAAATFAIGWKLNRIANEAK